jgi:hypothetical protein
MKRRAENVRTKGRPEIIKKSQTQDSAALAVQQEIREKMMDKTLADSFPASDPPSSIPDPAADSFAA